MNMAKERFIRSGAFAMSAKTIAEANLYDDELFLFSCYGNTAMTELILGIILGQPVKVRSFTPQKTLTNAKLSDKSVRFDVERTRWMPGSGNGRATMPRRWTPTCSGRDSTTPS